MSTASRVDLFDYIGVFYNQERRHSFVGGQSPAGHERAFW